MDDSTAGTVDCHLREKYNSCKDLPFYGEYDEKRYCVLHFPNEEKERDTQFEIALEKKLRDLDLDFSGVYFSGDFPLFDAPLVKEVINDPVHGRILKVSPISFLSCEEATHFVDATFTKYANFVTTFQKEARFAGAIFKEGANFSGCKFEGEADFSKATFNKEANFGGAHFSKEANFWEAIFEEKANFSNVWFLGDALFGVTVFYENAQFRGTWFEYAADFRWTVFNGEADFTGAAFDRLSMFWGTNFNRRVYFWINTFKRGALFSRSIFKEEASFRGLYTSSQTLFDFRSVTVEKPEKIEFHTVNLRPSWFIDMMDVEKFSFSDVEWFRLPSGEKLTLEAEVEDLATRPIEPIMESQSLRRLERVCRKLMNLAEQSRDYPTANEFHYWSMEARRKEGWTRLGLIATLYWALSGYGERPRRAFFVLVGIWLAFAALYFLLVASSPFWVFSASDVWQGIDYARLARNRLRSAISDL